MCCPCNLDDGCDAKSREDFCAKCPNKCSAVDSEESVYDINVVQKQVADASICPNSCLRVNRCTIKDLGNNYIDIDDTVTMRKCGRTKFCCKGEGDQRLRSRMRIQSPKFPDSNGEARPCQDHTPLCKGWYADHPESCWASTKKSQ